MTPPHSNDEDDAPDEPNGTRIDISVSVTDLLSELLGERDSESSRHSLGTRPRGRPSSANAPSSDGSTPNGGASASDDDYHVDSHRTEDDLTVVADLAGADRSDVTTGIDPDRNELVVGVDDRVAGRVDLPWDPVEVADSTYNNGILQVRLRPVAESAD